MHAAIEAIVIQGGPSRRPNLSVSLSATGWSVRDCTDIGRLGPMAAVRAPQVLVLEGSAQALYTLAGIARHTVPDAALIALAGDTEIDARIVALEAGADACFSLHGDIRELSALGRALARRRDRQAERLRRDSDAWHLASGGRILAGPRGQYLPLTFTESAFFLRLLASPGHRLPRERLVAAPVAGAGGHHSARSVDVMVSRLRAKAQRLGIELPLLAVRQWGYIFLADAAAGADVLHPGDTPAQAPAGQGRPVTQDAGGC